jgi:hypothetical protein
MHFILTSGCHSLLNHLVMGLWQLTLGMGFKPQTWYGGCWSGKRSLSCHDARPIGALVTSQKPLVGQRRSHLHFITPTPLTCNHALTLFVVGVLME